MGVASSCQRGKNPEESRPAMKGFETHLVADQSDILKNQRNPAPL